MSVTLKNVAQWGVVVPDLDEAMAHWSALFGIGPFMALETIAQHEHRAEYHGVESDVRITVAFSYYGDTQIELIQQLNDSPSPYVDFLAAGRSGIQHVGVWTDEATWDDTYAGLVAAGYDPVYTAAMRGVPRLTTYFADRGGMFGPMLELSLMTERKTALFAAMARRVREWDGEDPIERYRSMDELAETLGMSSWTVGDAVA